MEEMVDGLVTGPDGRVRCWWCAGAADARDYHDREWGFPVTDDARLFEKLCLEGFQAGLSWMTILRKREGLRRAFAEFDIAKVAVLARVAWRPRCVQAFHEEPLLPDPDPNGISLLRDVVTRVIP